jgi:hypothetical protein
MSKNTTVLGVIVCGLIGCAGTGSTGTGGDPPAPAFAACDVEGVEARLPDAAQTSSGAPDLTCYDVAQGQRPEAQRVIVQGCVNVFGVGAAVVEGVSVAVFARDADPTSATPLATSDVAVAGDAAGLDCVGADADATACLALACEERGYYRVNAPVPTDTPLIFRIAAPNPTVIRTFLYDVVLSGAAVDTTTEPAHALYDASLIYASTYSSIPSLGGRAIQGAQDTTDLEGRGVIAGEVTDCAGAGIGQVVLVDLDADAQSKVIYFNGNDANPQPDARNNATAADGRYANLNVDTDVTTHRIVAAVREQGCSGDDCTCTSLGTRSVRAFPDSVTLVSFRAALP